MRLVLSSFQGSRAILEMHYGENRHARLELDQLEDRYSGLRERNWPTLLQPNILRSGWDWSAVGRHPGEGKLVRPVAGDHTFTLN
jgi:hypothetical protein